ncbi:MAG TPA: carboxypeptidase regulatory-like domain-containing protein [Gemmatimonadaceae bacterium]|nr:carboxypeptidase regulatory-like domain-containing protein [Gemmatimonadaceae bacterium]
MTIRRFLAALAVLVVAALAAPSAARAQQVDVIRGRVTGPDSLPIESARVTVTSISGNVTRQARTDRQGRFTVTFPNGDGDYMVNVAALGFGARRFEVKRVADEDVLIADARLQRAAQQLDAVRVRAERERVNRNESVQPDIGGAERAINNAAVPADAMGDLAAMAASLPGVQLVPGENGDPNGFSVLGLGADQNNTTLNGMSFGGSNLPRDAQVSSSVVTSPYDVARGGFSGAQMSLRTRSGSNFQVRNSSLQLDAPQLQWTDAAARSLGQRYSNVSLGGSTSGPLVFDKAFYNVAWQLGRRANDYQSLLNTDALGMQAAGVASDSVARLLGILGGAGVPASVGRLADTRASDNASVFGSIDVAPPGSTSGQAFNLSFNGNWGRQKPAQGFGGLELPSYSGERTNLRGGLQGRHSAYFTALGVGVLSETSAGVSASSNDADPYLSMPAGRVRVNSTFEDGTSSLQNLAFGGNQGMSSAQRSTTAQGMNMLSWFSANNKHRVKLTSELRRESFVTDQTGNLLGTFAFNSLADLEANRPASYTRTLGQRERTTSQLVGGVSLGDAWRRTRDLQIQYGVRVDANRFTTEPDHNPAVAQAFGVRNDALPNRVYVSPRVGFSWTYGQAAQIGAFEGAFRGPRAVVRGGLGVFQNTPSAQSIGQVIDNTGLPSAVQQLTCVGAATPIPDWDLYAQNPGAVPTRCADGSTGSVFASSTPNVTLFADDYRASRSVRGNLQWSGPVLDSRFMFTADVTYSRNQHQQSVVDLNFAPTQRFTLADEGRPVFVNPSSIVPATGLAAWTDARVERAFSRVNELRSDLESDSKQLRLSLNPMRFSTNFSWSLSYVHSNVREQVRGFSGTTAGNPLAVEWARSGFDSRHQIQYSLGYNFFDAVRVNWFGSFRSGNPYTPMIAGDVNGDGWSNDRAYVFDPARSSGDGPVAAAMQSLLENGSKGARECLRAQLGQIASRNSCQGPWSQSANLSISFNPLKVRLPQRASLSLSVSNPLGAADMLLHGNDGLRGWGQTPFIDNSLLYVRGFDPATNRYRYEVNQRFGSTRPQTSAIRAPVALTAMLRFDVGPSRERQLLTQQLDRGRRTRGTKSPEVMLRAMYAQGGVLNPMTTILRQQDSLKLNSLQADSIASMNRRYVVKVDSIWAPLAREFANLPDDYDHDAIYDRYRAARETTVDLLRGLAPTVRALLTEEQRRKLPAMVSSHLEPRYLAQIRSGTAGFGMGGMFPMGGGAAMVSEMIMVGGGGGGGGPVIVRQ